jgi:alanine racemase
MALSWIEIDLEALRHNYSQARDRLSPGARVLGVVKSDAYGHGMVPVAWELAECGIHFLGVSKYWEAKKLRSEGISLPIIVLVGLEPAEMEDGIREEVRTVAFRLDHLRLLSQAACRSNKVARVHVKVDTGMGRLGVPFERVGSFLDELSQMPGIELEGLISHLAAADEADKSYSDAQIERFRQVLQMLADRGRDVSYAHVANSAGLLDLPHAHFHLARPGIMLYGSLPSRELLRPADLLPVMSFKSLILQLKDLPPGHPIGYGRTYVTQRSSRIATVPVGYDDGYPRLLSNRAEVLVRGRRAPVVGRVSMNMITLDVTDVPGVSEDDEVVLLGKQDAERITADEIADLCGTISYEIYCSIGKHRNKVFLNAKAGTTKGKNHKR